MSAAIQEIPASGLSPSHYNYLKCWTILNHQGREVFEKIFIWGFKKPHSEIRNALFRLPNYSNKMYRSDFNASQREKIEKGNLSEFDLGIFYILLHKICSLPSASDEQWGRRDPSSLPNMLYRIKMKRNSLAHNNIEMEEKEMLAEVDEMRFLFLGSLDAAAVIYGITDSELIEIKEKIAYHIDSVLNSSHLVIVESVKEVILKENELGLDESETKLAMAFKPIFKTLVASGNLAEKFKEWEKLQDPLVKETRSIIERGDPLFKEGEKLLKNFDSSSEQLEKLGTVVRDLEPLVKEAKPIVMEASEVVKKLFRF